jgi:hypothetical protein
MQEILDSQRQMLIRRGQEPDKIPDERMAAMYERHLAKIDEWLAAQPNIRVLYVRYNDILAGPAETARAVNEFLGGSLDEAAMIGVVDKELYRQRRD